MAIKKTKHSKKAAKAPIRKLKASKPQKKVVKAVLKSKSSKKLIIKAGKPAARNVPKPRTSSKKALALAMEEQAKFKRIEESKKLVEMVSDHSLVASIKGGVGEGAVEILKMLAEGPKTDEGVAEKLGVKVNDVRRMLNAMNSYSIVRYDVNKDNKGWLIFTWRIDSEKLGEYIQSLSVNNTLKETELPGNCNDFFVCKSCYTKDKIVLPFDSAYEVDFSCGNCGKPFAQLSREETVALFES